MNDDDEAEIAALMCAARSKARGYAGFFEWRLDRDLEELGVLQYFSEALDADKAAFFHSERSRERPNDPPDCEAIDAEGRRVAFELTELVDGNAIKAFRAGRHYDWADWGEDAFVSALRGLVAGKDAKFPSLKGGPYPGGYMLLVFTDEPVLSRDEVGRYLAGQTFQVCHLDRVFVILGYDPALQRCPYFELTLSTV